MGILHLSTSGSRKAHRAGFKKHTPIPLASDLQKRLAMGFIRKNPFKLFNAGSKKQPTETGKLVVFVSCISGHPEKEWDVEYEVDKFSPLAYPVIPFDPCHAP